MDRNKDTISKWNGQDCDDSKNNTSFLATLRKEIVQSCDTQCTEGDCDVILIKN